MNPAQNYQYNILNKSDKSKNLLDDTSGLPFKFIIFGMEGPYTSASSKPTVFVCGGK